jgi:tetratricopeptide (TPR) repeat protein
MGGVRNGNSTGAQAPADARQEPQPGPEVELQVTRHLQAAAALLREGSAPRAFGELVRASRSLPMTRRMAAALVRYSLKAGTEAAAIMVLGKAVDATQGDLRCHVRRQLARVLRRVDQIPRAIEVLDALLVEAPTDRRALRVLEALLPQTSPVEEAAESEAPERQVEPAPEDASAVVHASEVLGLPGELPETSAPGVASSPEPALPTVAPAAPEEEDPFSFELSAAASILPAPSAVPPPRSEPPPTQAVEAPVSGEADTGAVVAAEDSRSVAEPAETPDEQDAAGPVIVGVAEVPGEASQEAEDAELPVVQGSEDVEAEREVAPPELAAITAEPTVLPEGDVPQVQAEPSVLPEENLAQAEPAVMMAEPSVLPEENLAQTEPAVVTPEPSVHAEQVEAPEPASEPEPVPIEAPPAPAPQTDFHSTKTIEFQALSLEDLGGRIEEPEADVVPSAPTSEGEPVASAPSVIVAEEALPPSPEPTPEVPPAPPVAAAARPPEPAAEPRHDRAAMQRLEAQLIARKKWPELAHLYLDRADKAEDTAERAEVLTRLAEVLENELQDPAGAARTYGDIVALTGDRAALQEQVRLLSLRGDPALVQRALDEAVKRATTAKTRGAALLTRAERALAAGQTAKAWADFNAAEALIPGNIPVLAGLMRCAPDPTRAAMLAVRLRDTLTEAPRRTPDRLEALRTLASVAEESMRNPRLAQWAWTEVLGEEPEDPGARARLVVLARELKDSTSLARLLREQLTREPRGPAAREQRLELVATLEATGDADGALAELRQAVRMEPGHKEAWLRLVERCTSRGLMEESAWAQEHAATATADEVERMHAWAKLAVFCRDVLKDGARGQVFANRADNMRRGMEERGVLVALPELPAAPPEPPEREQVALGDEDVPVPPTSVLSWEAPPGKMEPSRRRVRTQAPAGPPPMLRPVEKPAAPPPPPAAPAISEPAALQMLRERPLEAGLYRVLAEAFSARGHTERGELMQELADALEGREAAEPQAPRVRLAPEDRAGLRHPGLRTPSGELFACVGLALCRLFPAYGPAAGTNVPLLKELGPGAPAAVEAIEVAARVLQMRLPDIVLSEESGPPFTAVHASTPRLLVGKLAVQQAQSPAELRFHAGRALFCLAPDLLALRSLKKDQLLRGLSFLSAVLYDDEDEAPGPEGRVLREALPPQARERAAKLLEPGMRQLDIPALSEAARHSANRAGLVACGGVGPALAVLRSRRALEEEVVELVRFAASERYLQLRTAEG